MAWTEITEGVEDTASAMDSPSCEKICECLCEIKGVLNSIHSILEKMHTTEPEPQVIAYNERKAYGKDR